MYERIRKRNDEQKKREIARRQGHLMLSKPPPRNWVYGDDWLELGIQIEESLGRPILNPRSIENVSLEMVDSNWLADMAEYRARKQYVDDFDKRPTWLR